MQISKLKMFVPFNELDDKYLTEVQGQIEEKTFAKGIMLFKRGRPVPHHYYLVQGRVDLIDADFKSTPFEATPDEISHPLNPESPTRQSCIAKSEVKVFMIASYALDRIVSWSDSAAIAADFNPSSPATESTFATSSSPASGPASLSGIDDPIPYTPPQQVSYSSDIEVSDIDDEEATDWMSSMLQSPLFSRIPLAQVQELFARFENIPAEAGEVIVREGSKGDYFYVVASGKAQVTNNSNSVDVVLEPGTHFGEESLLGGTPRNATVTMLVAGNLKRLDIENFEHLLKKPILQYIAKDELDSLGKRYKILDVKMPMEYRLSHIDESINVPLSRLRSSMRELAQSCVYLVADDAGSRADIAAHLLCQAGFEAYILTSSDASDKED